MLRNMQWAEDCDCELCNPIPTPDGFKVYAQKEKQMYTTNAATLNVVATTSTPVRDEAKDYAIRRIDYIYDEKKDQLVEDFEIEGKRPATFKEMKKWLADGNYRIDLPKGWTDDTEVDYWREFFAWGKEGPDKEGYDKARDALHAAKQTATDIIKLRTDEAARLDAINAFAAWTQ